MNNFNLLLNGFDTQNYIIKEINNAKKYIYLSAWHIDLNLTFNKKTLFDILKKKCNQGIKVYILTSTAGDTVSENIKYTKVNIPNFNFKILDMENSSIFNFISILLKYFSYNFDSCCDRLFHQRYFLVDGVKAMIGGCDMDNDMQNSLYNNIFNQNKYYWTEYGITFSPDSKFIEFCKKNFELDGKYYIDNGILYGNFYDRNTEYNKILKLIRESKESIFIENQYINSNLNTRNNIFLELAKRIIKSVNEKKEFSVILITNNEYPDVCHYNAKKTIFGNLHCNIYTYLFRRTLRKSLADFFEYLNKYISLKDINRIVHFYTISKNKDILVHSKNWIFDDKAMLYGTTNIWDRSYLKGKDIELSILLEGKKVIDNKNKIINIYSNNSNKTSYINKLDDSELLEKVNLNKINNEEKSRNFLIFMIFVLIMTFYIRNKYYS